MNGPLGKAARSKLLAREDPLHLEWAVPFRADMATVEAQGADLSCRNWVSEHVL